MEICIDSRSVNHPELTMFFALRGNNHDGHDYVAALYARGVRSFVVSEKRPEFDALTEAKFYVVEDVLGALQKYAKTHREKMTAEVIAITGSNGKTIVKEWLYRMLAPDFNTYRSPRSYNSQVGVPLSLNGIDAKTEVAIIEAGISKKGEMVRLENMIRPDVGIFTHLGDAHGENFASMQEKLAEKAILFRYCHTVVGREGDALKYIVSRADKRPRVVDWGESEKAAVRVRTLAADAEGRKVEVTYEGQTFGIHIPFPDEASFENCMHAVCVLLMKGVAAEKIADRVAHLQPIAMRMEIREGVNRSVLINDYYNSDATSLRIALNAMAMQDKSKARAVILSDFVDVAADADRLYKEVAEMVEAAGVSQFVGVGEALMRHKELFRVPSRFYPDTDSFLRQESQKSYADSVVLIKGARRYRFEYIGGFLQRQSHNTILEVDLDAMAANLNYFRSLLPAGTKMGVMVKAFSYGSGAGEVATLLQYQGVDYLMVAFADEGVSLRAAGVEVPIAVMNPEPDSFDSMIAFNLEPEIYSMAVLRAFDEALMKHGIRNYPVHLKLNTGMNRSGLDSEDLPTLFEFFANRRRVVLRTMFSHLAGSDEAKHDEFTMHQINLFTSMTDEIQSHFDYKILCHILNSAGIERFPQYHFDMARLGIGLHGISAAGATLTPVSTFKTYIASIRGVKAEETIGYGRHGVVHCDSQIAVVPVGYADGLNRRLSNGVGEMWVRGQRVPIIGNICMDTCMLDITGTDVQVGDEVEIFGRHIPVTELADKLQTIPYEVLTGVAHRVRRQYVRE